MAGVRELSLAEVFQLGYYWETKILLTAVKLDVFSALDRKSRTAGEVAHKVGADLRALALLLNALVSIGLLTKEGEHYHNTKVAQTNLVRGEPEF
ncbi:MAG: SAM-dependent methyltransferase, partial [Nitrospirae bacterium]|nr:SAM-dependent methyltransferase [Nitrospirota bacterium]